MKKVHNFMFYSFRDNIFLWLQQQLIKNVKLSQSTRILFVCLIFYFLFKYLNLVLNVVLWYSLMDYEI